MDKEPPDEKDIQLSPLNTAWYSVCVCSLLYERSSWIPAFAGMTYRESRNDVIEKAGMTSREGLDMLDSIRENQ